MLSRGQSGKSRPPGLTRLGIVLSTLGLLLLVVVGFTATPASATLGVNDYPSTLAPPVAMDSVVDPWGFYVSIQGGCVRWTRGERVARHAVAGA